MSDVTVIGYRGYWGLRRDSGLIVSAGKHAGTAVISTG